MPFFKNYPTVPYSFGDGLDYALFNNISVYVDLIDQVKEASEWYSYYDVHDYERPDTLSYKLYGTVDHHWTFFLLNDHIRESGWPIASNDVYALAESYYPNWVLTTQDNIAEIFPVGTAFTGSVSGSEGVVIERNLDLGQLIVSGPDNFSSTEAITYYDEAIAAPRSATLIDQSYQYLAAHHYKNSNGDIVDIDPFDQSNVGLLNKVTYTERLIERNDELKRIKILNKDVINRVSGEFKRLLIQ